MLITRKSIISGIEHTKNIPCTADQYNRYLKGWLIQDAMPNVSPSDREFIMTGITEEEWVSYFNGDYDEDENEDGEPAF